MAVANVDRECNEDTNLHLVTVLESKLFLFYFKSSAYTYRTSACVSIDSRSSRRVREDANTAAAVPSSARCLFSAVQLRSHQNRSRKCSSLAAES